LAVKRGPMEPELPKEQGLARWAPHVPPPTDLAKGALAGAIAGVAAAGVMGYAMKRMDKRRARKGGGEDPKLAVANAVVEPLTGEEVPETQKKLAGQVVHYATGAVTGALYGMAAEATPAATWGWGLPFGAAVWAALPAATLPALDLAPPVTQQPPKAVARNLGMHLLFGAVAETVRRPVRAMMGDHARRSVTSVTSGQAPNRKGMPQ